MKKRLSIIMLLMVVSVFQIQVVQGDAKVYHLVDGEEYMDKTFVYQISDAEEGNTIMVMCAEKDAPTYDVKKGLMTWVDYRVYTLEEIFGEIPASHIRSIIEVAGPHLDHDLVVEDLKERTGIDELTYDEVISAMQYAIWYFTDKDKRIPSTSNGLDLHSYFLSLPKSTNTIEKDTLRLELESVTREEKDIVFRYHYASSEEASLIHSYSKDLVSTYSASEIVTVQGEVTFVKLRMPITSEAMEIDFKVTLKGELENVSTVAAFAPDDRGSAQMLVGMNYFTSVSTKDKTLDMNYLAHKLTLDDDGDITNDGFTHDTFVSQEEIDTINPTGKDGYTFSGWIDEDGKIVTDGVKMTRDRLLKGTYTKDEPEDKVDEKEKFSDEEDLSDEDSLDDEEIPEDSLEDELDELIDIDDEEIPVDGPKDPPEESDPFDWIPKTGGVPLIIFLVIGVGALGTGLYVRKR